MMNYNFFITRKMAKKIFGFLFVVFRLLILSLSLKGSRRVEFGCISKYFPQQQLRICFLADRPSTHATTFRVYCHPICQTATAQINDLPFPGERRQVRRMDREKKALLPSLTPRVCLRSPGKRKNSKPVLKATTFNSRRKVSNLVLSGNFTFFLLAASCSEQDFTNI